MVVERLLELVHRRGLTAGQALPTEREIERELGVSRNAIRQGFCILEERGLVVTRRGSGRYLREFSAQTRKPTDSLERASIADILEARSVLEEQVVVFACQRRTVEEAKRLCEFAEHLDSWSENVEFHVMIAAVTHNFMFERLVRLQTELLGDLRQREHYETDGTLQAMREDHVAIAEAISARDERRARSLMSEHLNYTRRVLGE